MNAAEKRARVESLRTLIANYTRLGKGGDRRCLDAREELNRLEGGGLEFRKSFEAIRAAAEQRRFIAYRELADLNGLPWNVARRPLEKHLFELISYCHARGWPLITAIVVDKDNIETGLKKDTGLLGFARGAQELGIEPGHDLLHFLRDQQERVFSWAAEVKSRDIYD